MLTCRRFRSRVGAVAAFLLAAGGVTFARAATAGAQTLAPSSDSSFDLGEHENYRSAKHFALELRFAPYSPDIDAEFKNGRTPHKDYFGTDRRLMTQLEVDYQFFTRWGSAALGFSLGYFRESAAAFLEPYASNSTSPTPSGDTTRLTLIPAAVMLVYRADQAWRLWHVPLVPYAKLGLNYTVWSIYDGNGEVARGEKVGISGTGRGGTRGWQGAVGLAFALDIIDLASARELDSETGVNHTYIFGELSKYSASGLGQSNRLNVGDSTWTAGMMFEF